jgi:hypothetical protein
MPVEVGRDEDDEPIRSCVIVAVDGTVSPKAAKVVKLPKGAQISLRALQKAIGEVGASPPASNHIPNGTKAIHDGTMAYIRIPNGDKHVGRSQGEANRSQSCV